MAEGKFKHEKQSLSIKNESGGLETAAYRKCREQFRLTATENRFEHEIPLDFSPFLQALANYPSTTYERIESLLKLDHSINGVKYLFQNKHITCTDLCLFYLKRVQMINNYYKAIMELNPHLLSEAKQLDEQLQANNIDHRLLFGCVAGIKGNISIRDMYNDAGAYVLHEKKMKDDAPIVKKLREQGCIILGRTNLSEWLNALSHNVPSGFSAIGGQCLHPDDMHEDVGGSSSGSAAGIKLNLFTFTLGTETQGSIISPATHVRNVCALKPTLGTWPGEDFIPINVDQSTCGPMTRTIEDIQLLHRIASGMKDQIDDESQRLRVGYLGQSEDGIILLQKLFALSPSIKLIDLNSDKSLREAIGFISNPQTTFNTRYHDIICYALARDIPAYLSSHSSSYSHQTLSSIIKWNSAHPQYIPYGQSSFLRAIQSSVTPEAYDKYKQTMEKSFQRLVNYLRSTYLLDCLLTIDNDDRFSCTTLLGIPRATLTLDYYNPDHRQINVIVTGLSRGHDYLLLRLLRRLEKANLQAGKIDISAALKKHIEHPAKSVCSIH